MIKVGNVSSLFYASISGSVSASELALDKEGIIKDKHYKKDRQRSVLIASLDSYVLAREHGIDMAYGSLGENLLINYNPYDLEAGTRLKIADVTLEISQHCTLCKSFSKIDAKLPELLKENRGIFAQVVEHGCIKEGDVVYLVNNI